MSWMDEMPMTPAEVVEVWNSVQDKWNIKYDRHDPRPYEVVQYFGGGLINGKFEKSLGRFLTEEGSQAFAKRCEDEARAGMVLWRLKILADKQAKKAEA